MSDLHFVIFEKRRSVIRFEIKFGFIITLYTKSHHSLFCIKSKIKYFLTTRFRSGWTYFYENYYFLDPGITHRILFMTYLTIIMGVDTGHFSNFGSLFGFGCLFVCLLLWCSLKKLLQPIKLFIILINNIVFQ